MGYHAIVASSIMSNECLLFLEVLGAYTLGLILLEFCSVV